MPPIVLKSFASVIADELSSFIFYQNVLKPSSYHAIKINNNIYQHRLALCQFFLIGRIILSKGDSPWKLVKLKERLASILGLNSHWRLISLGRAFYHIFLSSISYRDLVWGRGSLLLKPGVLRLQKWVPSFDPFKEKTITTQLWIQLFVFPGSCGILRFYVILLVS